MVLHLLATHGQLYGYRITQLVREHSHDMSEITEGALYPVLHQLEDEGKLVSEIRTVNDRTRKYYTLSKKGLYAVQPELKRIFSGLQLLLK